ncbi:MAG TPA: SDR family NAD(P)-dependent oxidoreductase [bacterium]|jgi:NAD(P)-dependent dehydrogenase (short-subunit alcohol dehydrogenase family)|nr:SDR family NAD(P)-dependent oxidoreductase [bacterium]
MNPQRVLITGASSGLGAALALEHAAQGHALLLLARRRRKLAQVAQACLKAGAAQALCVEADVTHPAALRRAAALAERKLGGLDVTYVNAGYSLAGALATLPLASWRRQMQVNVEGALNTIQACLPLLAASRGRLGIVGSVVSYGSLSHSGAYAASKGALRSLSQVLALECAADGVSVTFIAPGFFASELRLKDAHGDPKPEAREYMPAWLLGDAAVLARRSRQAVAARRRELVWPLHAKLAVFFLRHMPGLALAVAARLGKARLKRRLALQGR